MRAPAKDAEASQVITHAQILDHVISFLIADCDLSLHDQVDACCVDSSLDDSVSFAESGHSGLHNRLHCVDHLDCALLRHESEEPIELAIHCRTNERVQLENVLGRKFLVVVLVTVAGREIQEIHEFEEAGRCEVVLVGDMNVVVVSNSRCEPVLEVYDLHERILALESVETRPLLSFEIVC
jgi:hypothetical protein